MKVRLHDDSIRIRLSQREVADLGEGRVVSSATHFAAGELVCEVRPDGSGLDVVNDAGRIVIRVAAAKAAEWSLNDQEGLYSMSGPCKIALEKDFACLHRGGAENQGTFPNPAAR